MSDGQGQPFNFAAARSGSSVVFGAERPGYPFAPVDAEDVESWIAFMRSERIERVICLLDTPQLAAYKDDLLEAYCASFGSKQVLSVPVPQDALVSEESLRQILEFITEAADENRRTVVHCSAGVGRTGQVLAAWLAYQEDLAPEAAVEAVRGTEAVRDPGDGDALHRLLEWARSLGRNR